MPLGLQTILADFLGEPMLVTLGSYLRMTALKSSFTAVSNEFDANSSTIHTDLQRLVFASYIATVNIFTETTLFQSGSSIINDIRPDGNLLPGVSDFVIFSNNVVTLSIKSLIVVPALALLFWIIALTLVLLPAIARQVKSFSRQEREEHPVEKNEKEEKDEESGSGMMKDVASAVADEILG